MIAKLQNPAIAAVLGIVMSVVVGVGLSMRVLAPLMEQAATVPEKVLPEEFKQRGWDFWTIEIDNLSNELKEERARLKKQSELLDQRAARIAAEEKELAKVRTDVETLRKEIGAKVIEITTDEMKNFKTLSQTYSTLTPKAVVAIVREMDDNTVAKIFSLMKTDVVGPIFEEMSKSASADGTPMAKRAAVLSERLRLLKNTKATPTS